MKVKELVEKLLKMDQEATVITRSDNFELNGADVELKYVSEYKTGSKRVESFRDAFDGGKYSAETWSRLGGNESVITV
jgi:hypothetical protein